MWLSTRSPTKVTEVGECGRGGGRRRGGICEETSSGGPLIQETLGYAPTVATFRRIVAVLPARACGRVDGVASGVCDVGLGGRVSHTRCLWRAYVEALADVGRGGSCSLGT